MSNYIAGTCKGCGCTVNWIDLGNTSYHKCNNCGNYSDGEETPDWVNTE